MSNPVNNPALMDDRELARAIERLDDDPWSLANIAASDVSRIPKMLFELMQRVRALEAEVKTLKEKAQ